MATPDSGNFYSFDAEREVSESDFFFLQAFDFFVTNSFRNVQMSCLSVNWSE